MEYKVGQYIRLKNGSSDDTFLVIGLYSPDQLQSIVRKSHVIRYGLEDIMRHKTYIEFVKDEAFNYSWEILDENGLTEQERILFNHPNKSVILKIKQMEQKRKDKGYVF